MAFTTESQRHGETYRVEKLKHGLFFMGMQKGFARPGYFFIDTKGIIREKFFEAKYRERLTGNSLVAKLFPDPFRSNGNCRSIRWIAPARPRRFSTSKEPAG